MRVSSSPSPGCVPIRQSSKRTDCRVKREGVSCTSKKSVGVDTVVQVWNLTVFRDKEELRGRVNEIMGAESVSCESEGEQSVKVVWLSVMEPALATEMSITSPVPCVRVR